MLHKTAALLRKTLPGPLFGFVRRIGTALLTPIAFSSRTGHFRSSLALVPVDRHGKLIPWYTYPMIEFLSDQDFSKKRILEWGAGASTSWWAARAASVLAFESNAVWYKRVSAKLPINVRLLLVSETLGNLPREILTGTFDVIVIDGLNRRLCAEASLNLLAPGGAILFDNSEGFWGRSGTYPVIDLLRNQGFQRVDFYGHAPGVIKPHCTSLFFKEGCFLLKGDHPPHR